MESLLRGGNDGLNGSSRRRRRESAASEGSLSDFYPDVVSKPSARVTLQNLNKTIVWLRNPLTPDQVIGFDLAILPPPLWPNRENCRVAIRRC